MKKVLQLEGLDCAGCAAELEELIAKIDGVQSASIAFATQKLTVEYDGEGTLARIIDTANHFEEVKVVEHEPTVQGKIVLHIENLDCPVCAEALQDDLQKIKGVNSVSVDYVTQTITLEADSDSVVQKVIAKANKFEEVRVLDGDRYAPKRKGTHLKDWLLIGSSAVLLVAGLLVEYLTSGLAPQIVAWCLYGAAYLTVGHPVLISTFKNIVKGRIFDENFLMTLASVGAIVIGEYSESVLVMLLYQLGELLQSIAVGSSRRSVAKLMDLKSEWATVLTDGEQKRVKPEEVQVGDLLLVKAGEKVPVDGILISETAVFDTKSLTGEAELKTLKKGDEILSGYINMGGMYEMKCIRPYADSAVGRILDMVENAASGKAKPEKFIAKFAKVYTPVVCGLAVLVAVCGPLLHGLIADGYVYFKEYAYWLKAALTFLVISCPCALVISVPLSYFSGIGTCAKNGILVKGATYLDVLAKAKIVAFDKTGTLTEGDFAICGAYPESGTAEAELLALAASVERGSAHPIAKAFENVRTDVTVDNGAEIAGRGLKAELDGETVFVGNGKLLAENGIAFEKRESLYTLVYVAKGDRLLGTIEVGDKLRPEVKTVLVDLEKLGLSRKVMLTGDNRERAEKIANEISISEVSAELLPDDKLKKAEELKTEGGLIYVGDGINDAPVMVTADCSVSMGKLGSAAAIEASDLVLISDDLTSLTKGIRIARKTRRIVMQNIIFSVVMKVVFMVLGMFGLQLWLAVFADVGVMLLAVLNSFRVRVLKK